MIVPAEKPLIAYTRSTKHSRSNSTMETLDCSLDSIASAMFHTQSFDKEFCNILEGYSLISDKELVENMKTIRHAADDWEHRIDREYSEDDMVSIHNALSVSENTFNGYEHRNVPADKNAEIDLDLHKEFEKGFTFTRALNSMLVLYPNTYSSVFFNPPHCYKHSSIESIVVVDENDRSASKQVIIWPEFLRSALEEALKELNASTQQLDHVNSKVPSCALCLKDIEHMSVDIIDESLLAFFLTN